MEGFLLKPRRRDGVPERHHLRVPALPKPVVQGVDLTPAEVAHHAGEEIASLRKAGFGPDRITDHSLVEPLVFGGEGPATSLSKDAPDHPYVSRPMPSMPEGGRGPTGSIGRGGDLVVMNFVQNRFFPIRASAQNGV